MIARVHDVLGRRLPPRALFDAPTIERLATRLAELSEGEELAGIPVARERGWAASAGQESMWFSERLNSGVALFTIPLLLGSRVRSTARPCCGRWRRSCAGTRRCASSSGR